MTSKHPATYSHYMSDYGFGKRVTVTELLKKKGYRTGHFGKWHIGPPDTEVDGTYGIDTVKIIGGNRTSSGGRDSDRSRKGPLYWRTNGVGARPSMRDGKWKLHVKGRGEIELYDLVKDREENHNVAGAHPEVVARMRKKLKTWEAALPREYFKKKNQRRKKS